MTDKNETTMPIQRTRAKRPAAAATAAARSQSTPAAPTKSDSVIKLLLRTRGATPMELIAATDWQPHTIRAFLSGLRKKGRVIVREEHKSGEHAYRIEVRVTEPLAVMPDAMPDTPVAE